MTGLAVVAVTLSRFIAATDPRLLSHLRESLADAESAGIQAADLTLLRLIIDSLS